MSEMNGSISHLSIMVKHKLQAATVAAVWPQMPFNTTGTVRVKMKRNSKEKQRMAMHAYVLLTRKNWSRANDTEQMTLPSIFGGANRFHLCYGYSIFPKSTCYHPTLVPQNLTKFGWGVEEVIYNKVMKVGLNPACLLETRYPHTGGNTTWRHRETTSVHQERGVP